MAYGLINTSNITSNILMKKPGDEAFWASFKFPRRGWDQKPADFNRSLQLKHGVLTPV